MPEEFATTIITELGPLKHVENTETVAELLAVYQSALGCTCSQLIQQSAYYTVLGELQTTLNELLRYHGAAKRIEIEARDPRTIGPGPVSTKTGNIGPGPTRNL